MEALIDEDHDRVRALLGAMRDHADVLSSSMPSKFATLDQLMELLSWHTNDACGIGAQD